jgi:hypothetical protein
MARLCSSLAFPLGGEGLSSGRPWIVNLLPKSDAEAAHLLRPVRLSVRDSETDIDPAELRVKLGYAAVHSEAEELFDELPRTRRVSLFPGAINGEPSLVKTSEGVAISKVTSNQERSVYATAVDAGKGYPSAMVSAVLRPDVVSSGIITISGPLNNSVYPGPILPLPYCSNTEPEVGVNVGTTVLGLEHGPRGTGVYLWFQIVGATKGLRLTGPVVNGEASPSTFMPYDWTGFHRYTIVWNEAEGYIEVYSDTSNGYTDRLFRVTIDSISPFPSGYYAQFASASEVVGLYGQEGAAGDKSTWKNIAVTTDVGFPILGNIRSGAYKTISEGGELVRMYGTEDPRDANISPWFDAPMFPNPATNTLTSVDGGFFRMTKADLGKTFVLYRDEPAFLRSNVDGFMVEAVLLASNTKQDAASTGMGITIYDGQTVFQLTLFNDYATKTIGLLKRYSSETNITEHLLPSTPFDWSTGKPFRFVVDPRREVIQIFDATDMSEPLMNIPLDRTILPVAEDKGWAGLTPFIAFGHTSAVNTIGTLSVKSIKCCHLYQAWEANSGKTPIDVATNPRFTATLYGSPSPTLDMVEDDTLFQISAEPGTTAKIHRLAPFAANRGAVLEARVRIVSYRPKHRTGVYLVLDDGLRSYVLTFVENSVGRFVALSKRADIGGFTEVVGKDGEAATLSFLLNWTEFHTYRMERRPYDGLYIFVDAETEPRLVYPESKMAELPEVQFPDPSIAFGQFSGEGAVSQWDFARGFFSAGYELSIKKNEPDAVLREQLFDNQAIVVAYAQDQDL